MNFIFNEKNKVVAEQEFLLTKKIFVYQNLVTLNLCLNFMYKDFLTNSLCTGDKCWCKKIFF